jgi:hypothetical protein
VTSSTEEARSLAFERQMPHPPEKIWRALTESWLVAEWLMANDFVAEVGHRFTFRAKPLPGFAAQHGMHWVNLDLPPANHSTRGSEEDLNRLGFWLGAGAQSNVDEGPDAAPPEADLATARHLGQRVAQVTLQFVRGRAAWVKAANGRLSCQRA